MIKVDYDIALEVASHEAIIRQAYRDSVSIWTWSVGITSKSGHNVERYIGKPQTLEHCLAVYVWALEKYADDVRAAFKGYSLTKPQFAAALSFHFNTGAIRTATWVKNVRAGDMAAAERSLKAWNKAGGKVSQGLVTRRAKEADLFFRGKWSNNGTMTEYTRLTSKSTPDWSSAKMINVREALQKAFKDAGASKPTLTAPEPSPVTTAKPEPVAGKKTAGAAIGTLVAAGLAGLLKWLGIW